MQEARAQYDDLCQGIMKCLWDGWECCFVPIVAGTKSMKEEAENEAMEQFGELFAAKRLAHNGLSGGG